LALAVARVVGAEDYFIRLLRQTRSEPGTPLAQAVGALKRKVIKLAGSHPEPAVALDAGADALARQDLVAGAAHIQRLITLLPLDQLPPNRASVLRECGARLAEFGPSRLEYLLLALHGLNTL